MAKYRITSIPQFRDGGRKNKKRQPVQISNWNSPVQDFTPESALTAFMPNTPIVEQPDLYNVDPMYNNPQQISRLENLDRKLKNIYLPERDSQGFYDELLPEDCPPGMFPYKGECISRMDYQSILLKEENEQRERYYAKLEELDNQLRFGIENRNLEEEQTLIADLENYINKSYKQNKTEKLKPFITTPELREPNDFWYVQQNAKGEYDYYPKNLLIDLIYHRGIRPNQNLKMIGGLDQDKFKEDFKEVIAIADKDFNINQTQELNKLIKSGMSAEEARNELVKRNSITKKGAEDLFKGISEELDVYHNADKYQTDDEGYMWKTTPDGKKYKYVNKNNQYETVTAEETKGMVSSENPLGLKSTKIKNQMNSDWEWVEDKNLDKFYTYPHSNNIYKQNASGQWSQSSDGKNWSYVPHGMSGGLDLTKALKDNLLKSEHKPSQYTNYEYNLRGDENKILKKYTQTVDDVIKYDEDQKSATAKQNAYNSQNAHLYDYVYGNKTTEKYPTGGLDNGLVSSEYNKLRADAIKKINATSDKKEKQRIYSEFYEQVRKLPAEKVSDFTVNPSSLPPIGFDSGALGEEFSMAPIGTDVYAQRDPNAYKNPDALKQVTSAFDKKDKMFQVRANYYAFTHPDIMRYSAFASKKVREQGSGAYDINDRDNIISEESLNEIAEDFYNNYPTFESYLYDPSIQKILNENPDLLRTGLNYSNFLQTKVSADKYYNEAEARMNKIKNKRSSNPFLKALSYISPIGTLAANPEIMAQAYGLLSDPLYTVPQWFDGKAANPDIIFGSDNPDMLRRRGDELYGPGAGDLINAENAKSSNFVRSGVNVFNPFHWAKEAGIGLGDKTSSALGLSAGDPDNDYRDIALNLVFAGAAPAKLMNLKLLPQLANTNKLRKGYNFARSLATPGNALHGYFLKEGFVPYTDEEGNTQQGFVVDAAMRTADNVSKMFNEGYSKELLDAIGYDLPALYMGYGMLKPHARQLRSFARGENPFQYMYEQPTPEPDPTITPIQDTWPQTDSKSESYELNDNTKQLLDVNANEGNPESATYRPGAAELNLEKGTDAWDAHQQMMHEAYKGDKPYELTDQDYYTMDEIIKNLEKHKEYLDKQYEFERDYPQDPGEILFNALSGNTGERNKLFEELYPGVYPQRFDLKLIKPGDKERLERTGIDDLLKGQKNTGYQIKPGLSKQGLITFTNQIGEEQLPASYRQLLDFNRSISPNLNTDMVPTQMNSSWFRTADAKDVVKEMRGSLGKKLTLDQINNATPSQLEGWRESIIKNLQKQYEQRWQRDTETPLRGIDAWDKIYDRRGAMNKLGGDVSTKFNKTELPLARYGRWFRRKNSKPEPKPELPKSEIKPKYEQLEFQFPTEVPSVVPETPLASEINIAAENPNLPVVPPIGLNLRLTADPNSAFYKAINPKTGEINYEQAIKLFKKTAGGDEVLKAMDMDPDVIGDLYPAYEKFYNPEPDKNKTHLFNVPAKTLLQYMQQSIPSLSRDISFYVPEGLSSVATRGLSGFDQTPNSVYGLHNIYPDVHSRRVFNEYSLGQNRREGISRQLNQEVTDMLREIEGHKWYLNELFKKPESEASKEYKKSEEERISEKINALEQKVENYEQNKDKQVDFAIFKPRTIQFSNESDFGLGSPKHRNKDTTLGHVHVFENPYDPDGLYTTQIQSDAATSYSRIKRSFNNDEKGFLEAILRQSVNRGMPFTEDVLADTPIEAGPEITDDYEVENIKRFLPQKKTLFTNKNSTEKRLLQETLAYAASIGKKYIYIPSPELSTKIQGNDKASDSYKQQKKHYIKLFGESGAVPIADQFGNNWLRLEVPESYSKGEGIIEAYKTGGYVSTKLTQKEIDKYVEGGYIIEDE